MLDAIANWFISSTASLRATLLVSLILIIIVLIVGKAVKKQSMVENPSTLCVMCEWLVGWVNGTCEELLGSRWRTFAPWIMTAGVYVFVANISGMFLCFFNIPSGIAAEGTWLSKLTFSAPTSNLFVTLGLGLVTGFFILFAGIKDQGLLTYLKSTYLEPVFIFLPMNILSEILTPVSLALRLFGNILSGSVIMGLIYGACMAVGNILFPVVGVVLSGVVAPLLHAIFDLFFGFIQAYVFMLLSAAFIGNKLGDDDPNYVPIYN